ncbi:amino acid ABC transporter permease [Nocardioides bruguierae]|uniref:Amino acid ABC transporter permease n=1 Tax=Nocardioides bruguierae TaxID=2945102 RepID=A0A9X2D6R2_9ACTN|nr:amino acid ABC transporter permease [Nocardioides bruguierae]MCL8025003.1 amino acid ABC transporter permease [Nocardioides bruguierae]MCM0620191.1 amino acid ABC transporter permease [Nocardioides bruguierae]
MGPVIDNLDLYWSGFLQSLEFILWCLVGSLLVGTVMAAFRVSPVPSLRALAVAYVNVFRNTPLTIVLFFMAFGLPELGINQSYFFFAALGLILYTGAFVCEALRSGVNAVPAGQAEAARALGLTFTQSMRQVILPQAFRSAIPPLGSVQIAMFKNSAVAGAFGIGGDLYSVGKTLTSARGYDYVPVLTGVAIGYLIITLTAAALLTLLERKVAIVR